MGLSRKTKRARALSKARKDESPHSREERRQSVKMKIAQFRINETCESKSKRLEGLIENRKRSRKREPSCSRKSRLECEKGRLSRLREAESPTSKRVRLLRKRVQTSSARKAESPSTRAARLARNRERNSNTREAESPPTRDARLARNREQTSNAREAESPSTRDARLACNKEQTSNAREAESPSTRDARLARNREQTSNTREAESPSTRDARLARNREQTSNAREDESPSSRERRLTRNRERNSDIREAESPSTRDVRLAQNREHTSSVREAESPTSRDIRLSNLRSYNTRRALFSSECDNFDVAISKTADKICYVCWKLCFPNQIRTMAKQATFAHVLPNYCPDTFLCCHRCALKLLKKITPSTAHWNNMTVAVIPSVLEVLNEIELRLISRITPFIKVIRLGGRFGQKGFKGQAVLFAQQVEEIAEQLPISIENSGLVIVTENLENVSTTKRYCVNMTKIRAALDWLLANNHLYANVQINLDQLQSNDLVLEVTLHGEAEHQATTVPESHYICIREGVHILRGSFHQGSVRFGSQSRGKQCTANAATAIAYSSSKNLDDWIPADLDRILLAGNTYYLKCLEHLSVRPDYLSTDELLNQVKIAGTEYNLEINVDVVVGLINPSNPSEIPANFFSNLQDGLHMFFDTNTAGIITSETQISIAVFNIGERFYLFDSHSRGQKGFVAQDRGTSMVMRFQTLHRLSEHLLIVLQTANYRDVQYSITSIRVPNPITIPVQHNFVNSFENNEPFEVDRKECHDTTILHSSSDEEEGEITVTNLMPIDTVIPDVTDVISNADVDHPLPIHELRRKTVPPVSVLAEQRAEELAWVQLFPDGKNGLRENRAIPITPLDYFQTRIMSNLSRFQINEYIFYALSVVELLKAKQNVSVCGRLRQDGVQPTDVVQNIHLSMRNIRGTQSYWHKAYTELLAMVRNIGPPHWYMTLSCNDLNWPDVLRALLVADGRPDFNIENLTFSEKLRLVESYPVTLSRQFMFRLNAFFRVLRREENPILLRKIIDFWYRIEFQLRGSPHVHLVLWCENMPPFDTPEGRELIDNVITCRLPHDDERLRELVMRVQTHKHTHTCFKNRDGNQCRFSFPRPVSEETKILDDDEALRNGGRFTVLKRYEDETMINNYNKDILKLWKANIDIQPCGSALGVAYYISKYISKSEPSEVSRSVSEAIRRIQQRGGNVAQQTFAIQNAILTHRQVSASECAFRLCHLKLRDSSRKCVFVNTCLPSQRYRMLRIDTENPEPFKNIFDRYAHRPLNLEHISLGEFAAKYEATKSNAITDEEEGDADAYNDQNNAVVRSRYITLLDNMGKMKERNRAAILRTRYFTPASDPEGYYYNLLVTHIPFRREDDLLDGFDTARDAFLAKRQLLRPLNSDCDVETFTRWEQEIQQAVRRLVAENMANAVGADSDPYDVQVQGADRLVDEVEMETVDENNYRMSDEDFERAVRAMNLKQRQLFSKISDKLLQSTAESLLVFITGGAGSGKTFVLKTIVEQIRRLTAHCYNTGKKAIAVTAPTGVAARLINGATLHSTFALPIEKGSSSIMRPLSGERLQRERLKWRSIEWLIIDEISMVPYITLRNIHVRLQELKQNQLPFGGINVLLFGDLMQLPPVSAAVGGAYCFKQPVHLLAETHLWQLFSFVELEQNMRQAGDTTFTDILNNLRVGELTMQQLEVLDSRRIPLTGDFDDGQAVRIYPTTNQVNQYNAIMTEKLSKLIKIYKVNAVDTSVETRTYGQIPANDKIPVDPNRCGGFLVTINIGVGSRVMLRRNININHGLVNGAMGVVRRLEWPALRRDQLEDGELPEAVFIEFDDKTIPNNEPNVGIRITPSVMEYDGLRGYGKIERKMLPVILCWAVTVHKLQGTTLDRAVVDLGPKIFAKGQAYVAISRVRSLEGLAINVLDPRKLLNNPHDKKSLEELERLRTI